MADPQRVFIVGCPRSGTTVVQALIARHPAVHSFPETGYFESLYGGIRRRWGDLGAHGEHHWYHRMGLARSSGRRRLRRLERMLAGRKHAASPLTPAACVRRYVDLLDGCARLSGASLWVEKTPSHLMYIDEIARQIPDALFIHVLRNGADVMASIMDGDLHQPTHDFGGGLAVWARRWNRSIEMHLACRDSPRHLLLCLEDLAARPQPGWHRIRAFLGLDASLPLLPQPASLITDPEREPWKRDAASGQLQMPAQKVDALLGPVARAWMRDHLRDYAEVRAQVSGLRSETPVHDIGSYRAHRRL
ncbi:MAG: sulfotransferase [Xanthomonadaceae bacterium]|nr:sulfotransferase [Xanthomonadaceae bacterium]